MTTRSNGLLLSLFALLLTAIVLAAGQAWAQEESNKYPSLYLGLAFAVGIEQFENTDEFSSFDEGVGFDFWVGLRINRYLGVEGQLTYLEGFDTDLSVPGSQRISLDFEVLGFTGNLKLCPWDGQFQPYLVGGVGGARIKAKAGNGSVSFDDTIARLGAGIDIYFAADSLSCSEGTTSLPPAISKTRIS